MKPDDTMSLNSGRDPLRPEIALSWQRSRLSGLSPATPNLRVDSDAVDRRSRLVAAAAPVLTKLAEQLADTPFCVLFADRESRIVGMPTGSRTLRDRLDRLGVVTGGVFLEETTGTNSIATAHELHRGVAVHGDEHYLEPFKAFSCYGHPISHPVTRRLEGVIDITCLEVHDSPLLGPLITRTARDIEDRLLAASRRGEQRLLAAFQVACGGHHRPVLVLGTEVTLANRAATELLDPLDHLRLRDLAAAGGRHAESHVVQLVSGQCVTVRVREIEPGLDGTLFEFGSADRHPATPTADTISSEGLPGRPVYIGGAPGTGRTTLALLMLGGTEVVVLDAVDAAHQETTWLDSLERAACHSPTLLVENIHLLPEICAVRLRRVVDQPRLRVVLTGAPLAELAGQGALLAAACTTHRDLAVLAERTEQLPRLIRVMLDQLGVGDRLRFTPATLAALAGHQWPGNLWELSAVVRSVASRRSAGDITPFDLPHRYQVSPRLRAMTPLERAEHDAILAALRACNGNKQRAAERLGISRTTLYNRLRALHLTA
ncbi:helix-turn-helix domain-containing protein [Nocardia sp. NPDC023852]|uniref:sigma-54-dependent Fis family transcriptional regulator n=1 Tax=Nocardia sp. NPDC023852 TaxID=3154697 RepID=UPI00340E069D